MNRPRWTVLNRYNARYEAELDINSLEAAGILVLVKGPEIGIFGPGFSGSTPLGTTLLVPDDALEAAREIIGLDDDEEDGSDESDEK